MPGVVTVFEGWFNQRKIDSKWRDVRLRKAVNLAVNRKELFKYGAKANAYNVGGGHLPPGAFGHNPNLPLHKYDTAKAKSLLAKAGYAEGFEVKIITHEACKLEAQIIVRMLERIKLKVTLDVLSYPDYHSKIFMPLLSKPPEEQDWDIALWRFGNWSGHAAASILSLGFLEESNFRWMEYDSVYEKIWKDMVSTVDEKAQEEKIQQIGEYLYDHAHALFLYSPLTLYAVNKKVNFVPYRSGQLVLKKTSVTENHWSLRGKNN